ncbi:MAG: hypothetical protein WCI73_15190, partial [Phycisphaerae bacterium]
MSFSHKAFVFDWRQFNAELAKPLAESLRDGNTKRLIAFGERHLRLLRDPYEGLMLPTNWGEQLSEADIQEVADYVLTKFYNPTEDGGIGDAWLDIEVQLHADEREALLGMPFGEKTHVFDPGRMGSYFQN